MIRRNREMLEQFITILFHFVRECLFELSDFFFFFKLSLACAKNTLLFRLHSQACHINTFTYNDVRLQGGRRDRSRVREHIHIRYRRFLGIFFFPQRFVPNRANFKLVISSSTRSTRVHRAGNRVWFFPFFFFLRRSCCPSSRNRATARYLGMRICKSRVVLSRSFKRKRKR